ncbi:hypothetical protein E3P96_03214 [Wallemia ichthyophaga]|nr:hypothetical protein E3P96_03214 [Wallemia ichthyophaga]
MLRTISNALTRNVKLQPQIDFEAKLINGVAILSGRNAFGQLGRARRQRVIEPTAIQVRAREAVTSTHTSLSNVYLTTHTSVLSAGLNTDKQLGHSPTHPLSESFEQVEWDFMAQGGVRQMSANGDSAGVLTNGGHVVGWGNSEYGGLCLVQETGVEPLLLSPYLDTAGCRYVRRISFAGAHSWFLDESGDIYTVGLHLMDGKVVITPTPSKVALPCKAINIWSGVHHSIALLEDRRLFISGPQLDSFNVLISEGEDESTLEHLAANNKLSMTFGLNGVSLHGT